MATFKLLIDDWWDHHVLANVAKRVQYCVIPSLSRIIVEYARPDVFVINEQHNECGYVLDHDKRCGLWIVWYVQNQKIMWKWIYENGRLNGEATLWHEDGTLWSRGQYQ